MPSWMMSASTGYRDISKNNEDQRSDNPVNVENVLEALGIPGKYQVLQIVYLCFCSPAYAMCMLNFVFIGYEPPHRCHEANETQLVDQREMMNGSTPTISYQSCLISVAFNKSSHGKLVVASETCFSGYEYNGGKQVSMVTEWDLVCEKNSVPALVQTMLILGNAVGAMILAPLSDRFGRKYIYIVTMVVGTLSEMGIVFAQNIVQVIVLRFVTGFNYGVMALIRGTITTELLVSRQRQTFGSILNVLWSICLLFLGGLAFFFQRHWRYLQLTTCLIGILPIALAFWLEESFVWYMAKGRYEDAERIVLKACKTNKSDVTNVREVFRQCVHQKNHQRISESLQYDKHPILDIVRIRKLFTIQATSCFLCMTGGLCYYGIFLISSTLFGNRYLNFIILALLEIPGNFLYMVLLFYWGRRSVLFTGVALVACSLLVPIILSVWTSELTHAGIASTTFVLFSHLVVAIAFNMLYTYSPELFPTTVRSTSLSLCMVFRRISGMAAPFFIPLSNKAPWAVFAILECLCLLSLCLIPQLPETRDRQLPTTVNDILTWKEEIPKREKGRE